MTAFSSSRKLDSHGRSLFRDHSSTASRCGHGMAATSHFKAEVAIRRHMFQEIFADARNKVARLFSSRPSIGLERRRIIGVGLGRLLLLVENAIPDSEKIEFCAHETAICIFRCTDDRLAANVEAGV